MRTNFNPNYSTPKANPAFGAIDFAGAKATLGKVLTSKELEEFVDLVDLQKDNKLVKVILLGRDKKLGANIVDAVSDLPLDTQRCAHYSQRFFEKPMSFIKRMVKIADKRTPEVQELVNKQNILNKLDKLQ